MVAELALVALGLEEAARAAVGEREVRALDRRRDVGRSGPRAVLRVHPVHDERVAPRAAGSPALGEEPHLAHAQRIRRRDEHVRDVGRTQRTLAT